MRDAFNAAFRFFLELLRLEKGTEAGRANIILNIALIVGVAAIYVSDRFGSTVAEIFGEDSSDFPLGFVIVTLVVLTIFCVSLIFAGELLRGRKSDDK